MGKSEFPRAAAQVGGARADRDRNARAARAVPLQRPLRRAKVSFAGTLSLEEVLSYVESMIDGLKKGEIAFRQGPDTLELRPSAEVDVKVKAATKGRKGCLFFEVAWTALGTGK